MGLLQVPRMETLLRAHSVDTKEIPHKEHSHHQKLYKLACVSFQPSVAHMHCSYHNLTEYRICMMVSSYHMPCHNLLSRSTASPLDYRHTVPLLDHNDTWQGRRQ